MDRNSLQLIINNDKALRDLDRFFKDSGELHLICDKIGRARDQEIREQLISKMKNKNKEFAESIVKLASMISTLKYNPQSPVAQ
jgi:ubiquinone/menaquinone biosynthesis C-methylase UbiE